MNKKFYFLINGLLLGLVFAEKARAGLEAYYPPLFGITLTSESPPAQFVLYLFMFLVALGSVIAFVVLVMAGFKMVMAGGEFAQISSAKNQFRGAFIGLFILFCSWLILNTINKNLTEVKLTPLSCAQAPICVEYTRVNPETNQLKTTTEMSIPLENPNLELKSSEKIVIKKYTGLKEIWTFQYPNFKGIPRLIYRDENYASGAPNIPIPGDGRPIESYVKSYKIVLKIEGIYLYDKVDFYPGIGGVSPFFLNQSIPDFAQTKPEFYKKAQSIQIESPRMAPNGLSGFAPAAILFSGTNYRGQCVHIYPYGNNASESSGYGNQVNFDGVRTENNPDSFFEANLASIIYYTADLSNYINNNAAPVGNVIFYNDTDCKDNGDKKNRCPEDVYGIAMTKSVSSCGSEGSGFQIKSIKINGPAGVVLMDNEKCQFFDKNDFTNGNCIASILQTDVTQPNKFMLLPIK